MSSRFLITSASAAHTEPMPTQAQPSTSRYQEKREAITQTFYKKVFGRMVKESGAKFE